MHNIFSILSVRYSLWLVVVFACLLVGWQVGNVRFTPHEDSIPLREATLVVDASELCPASIAEGLVSEDVAALTMPGILSRCVSSLRSVTPGNGRKVQLPHEWRDDLAAYPDLKSGRALYQMSFSFSRPPSDLWAVALPASSNNPAVFVNDKLIGWGGSFEQPVARNASRPLLFTVPKGVLTEGKNSFEVYLVAEPARYGFLDELTIGPAEMLGAGLQRYYFFRATLPQIITLMVLLLSSAMGVLWFYRRQDVEYGLCGLGGYFWSINTLNQFVIDIPFSARLWDWMIFVSVGGTTVVGVFFIHRFLHERHHTLEKTVVRIYGGVALVMLMLPADWLYPLLSDAWSPLVLAGAAYVLYFTIDRALKIRSNELYALAIAGGVIAMFGLHDLAVLIGWLPLFYGCLLHFGTPFLLVSFAWILLQRFVQSLRATEDFTRQLLKMNQELESRVEEKTQKIAKSYETIRLLGQRQVLLHERSRIMRDMHDGIGVYLTSMLRQLDREPVDWALLREAAQNALNDLRLMIDSLGSTSSDLPAMLGMFRTRIGDALDACNVELEWRVDELPVLQDFGPERALNLLRILQEAFTNALKHSGASCIRLSASIETIYERSGRIRIEVHDNGRGFKVGSQAGNGIKNMQYRAQKIKADFAIDSDIEGTCIIIILQVVVKEIAHPNKIYKA